MRTTFCMRAAARCIVQLIVFGGAAHAAKEAGGADAAPIGKRTRRYTYTELYRRHVQTVVARAPLQAP